MALQLSTGLRNGMLAGTGFTEAFANGVIFVYSGPQPINADAGVTGTLLGRVTKSGGTFTPGSPTNGLNFLAPVNGVVSKDANIWQMTGLDPGGTAGWFRLMGNAADAGGTSQVLARLDGTVAQSGGDLNLSSTQITVGAPTTIDVFQLTLPPT